MGIFDAAGNLLREVIKPTSVMMNVQITPKPENTPAQELESQEHHQFRSRLEFSLDGVEVNEPRNVDEGRAFQVRKEFILPLYWDAISIFPWVRPAIWRELNFRQIAERHFFETAFQATKREYLWLQQSSQARLREYYKSIVDEFDNILAKPDTKEEHLQQFLTRFPEVISPGYKRAIPKQALGPHVTDFIIEERAGEYLLVELESPQRRLFNRSGHEAADLTTARGQIHDWIRYIQDNKSTVERELKLNGISANPRSLVVIGRSNKLSKENRRKLQASSSQTEVLT
jgi:hypothetical protein